MDVLETSLRNANADKYIEKFRNNGIDASLLTTLTNEDLEVIGITEEHLKQQILECFKTLPTTIQKITQPTIDNVYVQLVLHQMSYHLKTQLVVLSCAINRNDIVKCNIKLKKGTESLLHCIESLENSILQLENLVNPCYQKRKSNRCKMIILGLTISTLTIFLARKLIKY